MCPADAKLHPGGKQAGERETGTATIPAYTGDVAELLAQGADASCSIISEAV